MAKQTIIFRADGNYSIGMGHFTRTLALAEMLNDSFNCIFATQNPSQFQINEIERICHSRIDLPSDTNHFNFFLDYLTGNELVVLDNYFFTTEYQMEIKKKGCKLVCIDDMHDKHFVADVVINHAEGVNSLLYSAESYTKLLLGFDYALIRKEFLRINDFEYEKEFSCLIMIGGTDPLNLTEKILNYLEKFELRKPFAVVSNSKPENANVRWFNNLKANEVSLLMDKSEFGIFPASTVSLEACAKRLPFICGYFTDNQIDLYHVLEVKKLAIGCGNFQSLDAKRFKSSFDQIQKTPIKEQLISNQSIAVDSLIIDRYLKFFSNL